MKAPLSLLAAAATLSVAGAAEGDSLPGAPEAPAAVSPSDFEALVKTSPFTRVLNLSETYALRGVATIADRQVATLYNRETKKTIVVTPEGNHETGIALVDVTSAPQLDGVTARISFAGDEAELRYETSQLYPQPKGSGGSSPSGRPGQSSGEPRGPSPQDIERYKALPEEKQAKLRDYIGHVMRNYPNMSREERGNLIRGAMVRLSDGRDIEVPAAPPGGAAAPGQGSSPQGSSNDGNRGGDSRSRGEGNRGGDERGSGDRRDGDRGSRGGERGR